MAIFDRKDRQFLDEYLKHVMNKEDYWKPRRPIIPIEADDFIPVPDRVPNVVNAALAEQVMARVDRRVHERVAELRLMQRASSTEFNSFRNQHEVRYKMDNRAADEFWRATKNIMFEELSKAGYRIIPAEPDEYMLAMAETALNDYYDDGGTSIQEALKKVWKGFTDAFKWSQRERI